MRNVAERGGRIGARRVAAVCRRLAEAARDQVPPDVDVTAGAGEVVLRGRNLRARSLDDPRLRAIALGERRVS